VAVKRVLGVVAQHPTLDRALTAAQNLSFHGAYFGLSRAERRARTATLLTRFGLDEHAGKRIDALSGGLAQRLMIARALVHEPVVLVLDEPTTGLDPEARRFVWEQSRRLRAEGVTQLLSTHDMHEAEALCDRVAIVDRGVVLACGAPDALRSSLGTAPVLELGVRTRADPGPAFAALGSPSVTRAGDGEWSVALAGEDATLALGAAHAAGLQVTALRRRRPSLEDVFFSLTRRTLG
jgi:ABC-2 type transport system ATP-binding protein